MMVIGDLRVHVMMLMLVGMAVVAVMMFVLSGVTIVAVVVRVLGREPIGTVMQVVFVGMTIIAVVVFVLGQVRVGTGSGGRTARNAQRTHGQRHKNRCNTYWRAHDFPHVVQVLCRYCQSARPRCQNTEHVSTLRSAMCLLVCGIVGTPG